MERQTGRIRRVAGTTLSSLRQRNFRLYFIGQAVSLSGSWMEVVAQAWLVLRLTNSGTALGIVSSLQFAPTLFFGPYAGVLADRFPKRRLLIVTQSLSGLLSVALGTAVATGAVRVWMVYATAAVLGFVNSVDFPTRQSFVYEMAGPEDILSAVGLNGTAVNLARVVGPALAGAVIAGWGLAVCFFLNAASFAVVIGFMLAMRAAEFFAAPLQRAAGGLRRGFAYAAKTPVVFESLVMMALVGTLTYEFSVTLPMLVKFVLDAGPAGLAYLMSSMGIGAAIGGLVTAGRRNDRLGRLAGTSFAFGLGTAAVGLAPSLQTATVIMFFVGIFSARFTALSNGLLQLCSSTEMRSRMMALWTAAFFGSTLIGGPLVGWVGEHVGTEWAFIIGAAGGVAAGVVGLVGAHRTAPIDAQEEFGACPALPGR